MRLFFIFFLIFFFTSSFSQTATLDWQNVFGGSDFDLPQAINKTADGGTIIAGTSYSANGDFPFNYGVCDIQLVKLKANGTVDWRRNYGGSDDDGAYAIEQATDGGYILCGYTKSNDGDVQGQHGISDCWVAKLDAMGNIQWQKTLGGTDYEVGLSIKQTQDKGFIVAGYTKSNDGDVTNKVGGNNNQDIWLIKLDATGTIKWQKTYGGTNHEIAYKVITVSNGFVVAGMSQSANGNLTANKGQRDIWVFKTDLNGNQLWQHNYGGSSNELAYDIKATIDGGFVVVGSTTSNDGDMLGNHGTADAFVMKLDANGLLQWNKCYGGTSLESAKFVHENNDGTYFIAGTTESNNVDGMVPYGKSDYWLVGITSIGTVQWQQHYGGSEIDDLYAACIDNNSIALAGTSFSNDHDVTNTKAGGDYWIVSLKLNTPVITVQPNSKDVCAFQNASFALAANNATAYQWQVIANNVWQDVVDNTIFNGASTNTLSISNVVGLHQAKFRCKISNSHSHIFSNEVSLTVLQLPAITVHPKDTKTCSNTTVQLSSLASNATSLQWQILNQNNWVNLANANKVQLQLTPVYNGTNPQYRLQASNICGAVVSNAAIVTVANCNVPNAFSPNGDGVNDIWDMPFLQTFPNHSVQVFNRNGNKVFEAKNSPNKKWDGTINGKPLPIGVYYYIVQVEEVKQQLSGSLMLVR